MPGPAPKPTALKLLEGNPGKRKLNTNEPKPKLVAPKCPGHLDEVAKKEWKRLVPVLLHMRVLSEADQIQLALLCQTYSRMIEAQEALSKSSLLIKTGSGYVQQSPLIGIISTCTQQLVTLCREFGLSPAARTKITADQQQATSTRPTLIR
jgi:P27 family predicted phage terminase small subunit